MQRDAKHHRGEDGSAKRCKQPKWIGSLYRRPNLVERGLAKDDIERNRNQHQQEESAEEAQFRTALPVLPAWGFRRAIRRRLLYHIIHL